MLITIFLRWLRKKIEGKNYDNYNSVIVIIKELGMIRYYVLNYHLCIIYFYLFISFIHVAYREGRNRRVACMGVRQRCIWNYCEIRRFALKLYIAAPSTRR